MASPGRPHPPSQARALVQEAKSGRGRPIRALLAEAASIADPSFAAEALFALSQDTRLDTRQAAAVLDEVAAHAARVERGFRKAELLGHLARKAPAWRPGPSAAQARAAFAERLVRLASDMPAGQHASTALRAVADAAPPESLPRLLDRALSNPGFEADDAKAVLRAAVAAGVLPPLVDRLQALQDVALRARLLGALHHQLAKTDPAHAAAVLGHALASASRLEDAEGPAGRVEVLRSLVASTESLGDLHRIVEAAEAFPPEGKARILSAAGGRADRLGDAAQARAWMEAGLAAAAAIAEPGPRAAVAANLHAGLERLGGGAKAGRATRGTAKPAPAAAAAGAPPAALPAPPSASGASLAAGAVPAVSAARRHVLALYDTYEGGLKEVHLRAIARAAPLCHAFDLDLGLLGFPAGDLGGLLAQAASDTNVGDGGRYLRGLAAAGRVLLVPCTAKEPPADWRPLGLPVATTSEPDPGKAAAFADLPEKARALGHQRVCLVMGLGRRGLPPSLLRAAPVHLELTGRNVALETATAMGVLAERLRQLPPP